MKLGQLKPINSRTTKFSYSLTERRNNVSYVYKLQF